MSTAFARTLRRAAIATLMAGSALLTGCASFYVDTATRDVPVAQFKKVANPKPVALTFEFQSRGAPNARATEFLQAQVREQVAGSGLFSAVTGGSDSARLNVQLNNVPKEGDNAMAKGFVTGLTFGVAGNVVTDLYECKITYLPPGQGAPLVTTARHAVHTSLGATGEPANAVKSTNMEDAIRTMTRQIVANALNDLSQQATFN
jgi:hypothetical protein